MWAGRGCVGKLSNQITDLSKGKLWFAHNSMHTTKQQYSCFARNVLEKNRRKFTFHNLVMDSKPTEKFVKFGDWLNFLPRLRAFDLQARMLARMRYASNIGREVVLLVFQ